MDKYVTIEETILAARDYREKYPEISEEAALLIHLNIMEMVNALIDQGYTREEIAEACKHSGDDDRMSQLPN